MSEASPGTEPAVGTAGGGEPPATDDTGRVRDHASDAAREPGRIADTSLPPNNTPDPTATGVREPWRVPRSLEVATSVAWRVLLIAGAAAVVLFVTDTLAVVVFPVVIALIAASLLSPEAHALSRHVRWLPHSLATATVIVGGLAAVGGVFYGVVVAFLSGLPQLSTQLTQSATEIQDWLRNGPLGLNNQQFSALGQQLLSTLQESQAAIARSALGAASTLGEVLTELLLVLFVLIFFIHDGGVIWRFVLRAVPGRARDRADVAGRRAFASLVGYTRAIVVVAAIDAITAGLGLWLIGVPLAVPLAALIFFGAFVPTLGAVVSGAVAALVALVSGGITDALLVVLLLLAVQNLEGYILQPLFLGRSIKLHPLAVVLPIACGLVVAGIPGALLAVPLVTVIDTGVRSLTRADDALVRPDAVEPLDPRSARPDAAENPHRWHVPTLLRARRGR